MVWWEEAGNPEPWRGVNTGNIYHPLPTPARWNGKGFHLGKNKEVFDAELYAIFQATMHFAKRNEDNQSYTIFVDSTSAIKRCFHDRLGPGQQLQRTLNGWCREMGERGDSLTIRWVPGHANIEGNEVADFWAKNAAQNRGYATNKAYLNETSLAFMSRKATEARSDGTTKWIAEHSSKRSQYKPPTRKGMRKPLKNIRKGLAARYYQLLTGHAITAVYLHDKIKTIDSDQCWWCESGKRQSRHHLFTECERWLPQIKTLWKEVGRALGWKHPKSKRISDLFRDDKTEVVEAVLEFLRSTDIGKPIRVVPPADESDGGSDCTEEEGGGEGERGEEGRRDEG